MDAGTLTANGDILIGNGTNTGILIDANTNGPTVNAKQDFTIKSNTTFSADNAATLYIGVNYDNQGGTYTHNNGTVEFNGVMAQQITRTATSETFYNFKINNSNGGVTVSSPLTTLNVNDYTNTTGTFTSPSTMNVSDDVLLTSGTLVLGVAASDGTELSVGGDWTNNGGNFTHNSNTVTFNSIAAAQQINGSAATQTFGTLQLENTGQTLSVGGSTTTVEAENITLTATAGTLAAPGTVNVEDFLIQNGTYTAGANTNLSGDITFNGGTLTLGANTFSFVGTADQSILNGTATFPAFNNLTINNTAGTGTEVTFNEPITVNGTLTLTEGRVITSSTNLLSMGTSAIVSGGSDDSFIKGPMRYTVNVATPVTLTFPVGQDLELHKMILNVDQVDATSTTYTGEHFNTSAAALGWSLPTTPDTIDHVSLINHWEITKGAGASVASASIQLFYTATDDVGASSLDSLRICKGNPNAWVNIGGTGAGSPAGSITSDINFTTFSRFALGNVKGALNPLPVELLEFDAKNEKEKVRIHWTTITEVNNDYFVVQRSNDGKEFTDWTTLDGAGNSNTRIEYSAIDTDYFYGTRYYRLKQVDFDGTVSFSQIESVYALPLYPYKNEEPAFVVFPNPSSGEVVYIQSLTQYPAYEEILVAVIDMNGNEYYSRIIITDEHGKFLYAIDPYHQIPPGAYVVLGSSNDRIYSQILIVE